MKLITDANCRNCIGNLFFENGIIPKYLKPFFTVAKVFILIGCFLCKIKSKLRKKLQTFSDVFTSVRRILLDKAATLCFYIGSCRFDLFCRIINCLCQCHQHYTIFIIKKLLGNYCPYENRCILMCLTMHGQNGLFVLLFSSVEPINRNWISVFEFSAKQATQNFLMECHAFISSILLLAI